MPYHLIGVREVEGQEDRDSEKTLVLHFMNRFTWDHYSPELNDFGDAFGSKTVFITRSCMVVALYFEVTWARGERWIFPLIPELMSKTPLRQGGKLPEKPTCSKGRHADNLKLWCREAGNCGVGRTRRAPLNTVELSAQIVRCCCSSTTG